jgi:simple sugar transport system ATP-binding protein
MTVGATAAVELRELTKQFGSCVANAGVNLRVQAGTIHGIVGENGAGKSTAMKMLYGIFRPDTGEIFVEGKSVGWDSPSTPSRGIGMVHNISCSRGRTALDNILLGAEPRLEMIDRKCARLETLAHNTACRCREAPVENCPSASKALVRCFIGTANFDP